MKNLIIRTITGAIFVAIIIFSAIFSPELFALFFLLMTVTGLWEFQRLIDKDDELIHNVPGLFIGAAVYCLIASYGLAIIPAYLLWIIIPLIILLSSMHLLLRKENSLRRMASDAIGIIYVVIPLALLNLYLNPTSVPEYHTPWGVLGMFLILWTHDTFAYLTGSMFGKHALSTSISPKKSWEGSIGGLGFAIIAAYIVSIFSPVMNIWLWVLTAFIIAVFGTLGDLTESLLKRKAGVKDSGSLLPGHGGVLDRFDSVLFVSPIIFILILLSNL